MNRYVVEVRDAGFFRYRVMRRLGYVSRAGNDSLVAKRFRSREKADQYAEKKNARVWK